MLFYQEEKLENILVELCGLSTVPHSGLNDFITWSRGCHNFSGFVVTVNKVKEKTHTLFIYIHDSASLEGSS